MAYHSNQDSFERDTGHDPGLSQSNVDVCLTLLLPFMFYFFCLFLFNLFKKFFYCGIVAL